MNQKREIIINVIVNAIFLCTSFLCGGLLCYFHWEAMLISHVAMRVTTMPFDNMQELYDSDYKFSVRPGTSMWDAFKNGNAHWQRIYKDKLEPFREEYKKVYVNDLDGMLKWMLENERSAVYVNPLYIW